VLSAFSAGRAVAEASLAWGEADTQWGTAVSEDAALLFRSSFRYEDAALWQQEEPGPEEDGSDIQVGVRTLRLLFCCGHGSTSG
jgi:hypothetical protein